MTSLLLIEPHWEGHNMRYVAWISAEATRRGYDVWLATSDSFFGHPLYQEIQAACGGLIKPIPLIGQGGKPFKGRLGYKFHYHRMFASLYRSLQKQGTSPDYILIPYLDYCAHAAGILGSPFKDTPWGGIFINPDFHLEKMGVQAPRDYSRRIKEKLLFKLLAVESLNAVFTFDELLLRYAHEKSPDLAKKIRFLPEPVDLGGGDSREEARRRLSLSPTETVILVYGVIDHSKGLDLLFHSVSRKEFPKDVTLLVAGPQDEEMKSLLSSPLAGELRESGRLRERDEFLHGPEEHAVFLASDVVWVGYRGQYISSGVLLQAGMAGLPIVACNEGLIGWLAGNYDLGLTVDPNNSTEVATAVSKLARDKPLAARLGKNGEAHSRGHTVERFTRALGDEMVRYFPLRA